MLYENEMYVECRLLPPEVPGTIANITQTSTKLALTLWSLGNELFIGLDWSVQCSLTWQSFSHLSLAKIKPKAHQFHEFSNNEGTETLSGGP